MRDERSKGWDNRLNGSLLYCTGAGNELNSSDARGLQQNDPFLMLPFWKGLSSHTLRWCAASAQESTASFKTPTECGIISSAPLSRVGKPPGTPSFTHAEAVWCVKSYVTVVIYLCRLASIFLTFTSPHWFFFAEFCSYIVYTPTLQCNRK